MEERPGMSQTPPETPAPGGPPLGTGTAPALRFVFGTIVGMGAGTILSFIAGVMSYQPAGMRWVPTIALLVLLVISLELLRRRTGGMFVRGLLAGAALALLGGTLCSGSMALSAHPLRIGG
jgi:hypothetical protein